VAALPDSLERKTHVDLRGRNVEPRVRFGIILLFAAFIAAGLANLFGQATSESAARGADAEIALEAPSASRGGLIYQVRFRIRTRTALKEPALVLDPGWFEGLTINTFEPEPVEWKHRDGRNIMVFGPVPGGQELVVRLQFQVNPTAVGRRQQGVVLEDEGIQLVRLDHDMTIYP
jgi:hypothetical protein